MAKVSGDQAQETSTSANSSKIRSKVQAASSGKMAAFIRGNSLWTKSKINNI